MEGDLPEGLEPEKDRNFITALARGLDLLRAFRSSDDGLTNQDFAQRTGLPKPTVSRLTHTLCALDYLVNDPRTGTYRLGAGVLRLGFGALAGMEMPVRAREAMKGLSRGPNPFITVALAERHGLDVVYIAVERSQENVSLTMHVGARLPLFTSAMGRAILLGMRADKREELIVRADAQDPAGREDRKALLTEARAQYEAVGYISAYGKWRADVNGIAAPILTLDGDEAVGLNVGGPSFHVKKRELESVYAKLLVDAAHGLNLRPAD
ncbi:MAG: IclR family transcriptional regulator [Pseudomonadota bacterium]